MTKLQYIRMKLSKNVNLTMKIKTPPCPICFLNTVEVIHICATARGKRQPRDSDEYENVEIHCLM